MAEHSVTICEVVASNRFEAVTETGEVAGFAQFSLETDGSYRVFHAEVDHAHEGRGVGSDLAQGLLDSIRDQGRQVIPDCPFIAEYIRRHREYADLVRTHQDEAGEGGEAVEQG